MLECEINYSPSSTGAGQVFVSLQLAQSYRFACHLSATKTPITLIARNGLISHVNQDMFFEVINTDGEQQIIAKGLSTSSEGLNSGALYKSDSLVSAFTGLIGTLKEIVSGIRSVGNNESNSRRWNEELDAVLSKIEDSGLIAAK